MAGVIEAARRLDAMSHGLSRAEAFAAPLRARTLRLQAGVAVLNDAWKAAVAGKPEESSQRLDVIQPQLALARDELGRAEDAIAPLESRISAAKEALAAAAQVLSAVATPGADGSVPLRTAMQFERLSRPEGRPRITHVLLVLADTAGADTVTRRVLLGESGRASFLAGVSNSWLLLDVDRETVIAGGPASNAQRMLFDLGTGESSLSPVAFGEMSADPIEKLVTWTKYLAVAICVFLVAVAAAQVGDLFV